MDPDPVCSKRLDPDPVNIRPDSKPCTAYITLHLLDFFYAEFWAVEYAAHIHMQQLRMFRIGDTFLVAHAAEF